MPSSKAPVQRILKERRGPTATQDKGGSFQPQEKRLHKNGEGWGEAGERRGGAGPQALCLQPIAGASLQTQVLSASPPPTATSAAVA